MMTKLVEAIRINRESETAIREYSAAVRALAQVCEDEETKTNILLALEDVTGKSGFMEAVRSVLRNRTNSRLTPSDIRGWIVSEKIMDLSGYSNALASIHTTLRRLEKKGEVRETTNERGEKAYSWILKAPVPPGYVPINASGALENWKRAVDAKKARDEAKKK